MQSITMCQFTKNNRIYKIAGNLHTLEQLHARNFAGETVQKMVRLSIDKMEIQKTYAVISGNDKLLVLRIHEYKLFIITVLIDDMEIKRNTNKIYLEGA